MGTFAQQSLPLADNVLLTIQRVNHTFPDTILVSFWLLQHLSYLPHHCHLQVPYRSKIGASTLPFSDTASWRAQMCTANAGSNGEDIYSSSKSPKRAPKHFLNELKDESALTDVVLPPTLQPALVPVSGSLNVAQFYLSKDKKTGILALGSFSDSSYNSFLQALLDGLLELKALGATQLIVDVVSCFLPRSLVHDASHWQLIRAIIKSNNGGGYICAAHVGFFSDLMYRKWSNFLSTVAPSHCTPPAYRFQPHSWSSRLDCWTKIYNRSSSRIWHYNQGWPPRPTHRQKNCERRPWSFTWPFI